MPFSADELSEAVGVSAADQFGVVGLLAGRRAAYGDGGLVGAGALLAGAAVAH